jgi:hypothetical protein
VQPESHVWALVRSDGRSVKQIERDAGLGEGAIAYYLKPSSPDRTMRLPKLNVMERFAEALGQDFEAVSRAFIRDAGIPSGEEFTPDEVQMIHRYRALPEADQARLRDIFDSFEQHPHPATTAQHATNR